MAPPIEILMTVAVIWSVAVIFGVVGAFVAVLIDWFKKRHQEEETWTLY